MDEQYCQVKFESFGFTNKQVKRKRQTWINSTYFESFFIDRSNCLGWRSLKTMWTKISLWHNLDSSETDLHLDDDDGGEPWWWWWWCRWPKEVSLFVFPYYPLHSQGHGDGWHNIVFAGLSLHFQGHTDGCLLYRLLWHLLPGLDNEGDQDL